jgi:hypothetical protein
MMDRQFQTGLGFALVAAGALVAVLGYLGVSKETEVAFQLPYFASAGIAALMLLGAGAGVLLSTQLQRDTDRIGELEDAVRTLAIEVTKLSETASPGRARVPTRTRSKKRDVDADLTAAASNGHTS